MSWGALAGWAGAALGAGTTIVQVVRVRGRGTEGVNATTWALFLSMSGFWFAYGLAVRSPEIVTSTVVAAPFLCWLLALLGPAARRRALVPAVAPVLGVAFLPALAFGWSAGVLGLGVLIVATRLPQLVQLVRHRHAIGVSVGSWLLGASSVALWLVYYVASARVAAAITMCLALGANLGIAVLAAVRHRQAETARVVRAPLGIPTLSRV